MAAHIGPLQSLSYFWEFRSDPIALMDKLRKRHGDLVHLRLGPKAVFFCFHPNHAEQILKRRAGSYQKSPLIFRKIRPLTGPRGLVQLEGDEGRTHRTLTGTAVNGASLEACLLRMRRNIREAFGPLDRAACDGTAIDLAGVLMPVVLKNATYLVLGDCGDAEVAALLQAFLRANALCGRSIRQLVSPPLSVPTPANVALRRAVSSLDAIVYAMIDRRRAALEAEEDGEARDLLSLLLREGLDRVQIRDHLLTYLFAGYETSAASLVWTFLLLARDRDACNAVRAECAPVSAAERVTLESLRRLPVSLRAYQEALRLFPPAWTLAREALHPESLDGVPVPKGALLLLGVRQIHTHSDFWHEPEAYRPGRFDGALPHPFAFIPFGGGSRFCIGMRTAFVEAALVLSELIPRYAFTVAPSFEPRVEAMITAHPKAGLPVTVNVMET